MNKLKGLIYAIISAISFGVSPVLIAMTYEMGNNFMMMAFARNILVLPFIFIYIKYKKIPMRISKEYIKKIAIMTVFGTCTSLLALYLSYTFIPVSLATSLHFIYPTIVAVLSVIVFKEYMSNLRKLAVFLSLIGVLLFIDLKGGSSNLFIGIGLALLSGSAYSYYIIYMARSGVLRVESILLVYYSSLVSAIFLGAVTLISGKLVITSMSLEAWGLIFLISIMLTFLGTMFTQLAVLNLGTTITSVMSTLEPITTIILGVVLFKEHVSPIKLLACILILLAVLFLALDQKQMAKKRAKEIEKYEDIIY